MHTVATRRPPFAFTLIEMLIVITVIVIAVSLFASYTAEPEISRRLTTGRQMVWAKLREARGVAAMRQNSARLLLHMDPRQPDLMLKSMAIVAETEAGSGRWELVHDAEKFPRGVCWVPPDGGYGWTGPLSAGGRPWTLDAPLGGWRPGASCWAFEFHPTGRITSSRYDLCLAQGTTEAGDPVFYHPRNFRAVRVNSYGQVSELSDADLVK